MLVKYFESQILLLYVCVLIFLVYCVVQYFVLKGSSYVHYLLVVLQTLANMDMDDILAKQVEQLEKEKREREEKLKIQEKKVITSSQCVFISNQSTYFVDDKFVDYI